LTAESMNLIEFKKMFPGEDTAEKMYKLIERLYPICRSITGNGLRETLSEIQKHIPISVKEIPTGTKVFDWTVPKEWNINDAYIKNSKGERVIDFKASNLHVLSYSIPIQKKLSLNELKDHIYTLPDHPDWIPYRTSYYDEKWGFCMSQNQFSTLKEDDYEVCIDSRLEEGHLTYGEYVVQGRTRDEILISCHICHPSLCNDNLSGISLATFFAKYISRISNEHTYRFLFIPGTIGSITWLSLNEPDVSKIKHGLVIAGVGDSGKFHYKSSRRGDAEIDQASRNVLKHSGHEHEIVDFFPYGYDERQYCSPGFNLPVGCFGRTPHGQYPEYHTSADNLEFIRPVYLYESLLVCTAIAHAIDNNRYYMNQNPKCEPLLGKRGLYDKIGGGNEGQEKQLAMLWVLNFSDGNHSLLDISDRSGLDFELIKGVADLLVEYQLLNRKSERIPRGLPRG